MTKPLVDPVPVPTDFIRTPVHGPAPANLLAFVRCRASGADVTTSLTDLIQFQVRFTTKFKIDGFAQAKLDWYLDNTRISATGMIRLLSTTAAMGSVAGLDSIDPFIDTDGALGFVCAFGLQVGGGGMFDDLGEIDIIWDVCAYVLTYELVTELPPSGHSRPRWRDFARDDLGDILPLLAGGGHTSAAGRDAGATRISLRDPARQALRLRRRE